MDSPKVRPTSVTGPYWPNHRRDRTKLREFEEELWREMGLPNDAGWTQIDLDSQKLPDLVARLAKLKQDGLVYPARGTVEIKLVDTPEEPCEWFLLNALKNTHHIEWMGTTCKADKACPGVHVAPPCVDEKFKLLVEKSGFTGLEFMWLQDKAKYAAPQWFYAFALNPIGRGIDHQFFDSSKIRDESHAQPNTPESRNGVICFGGDQLKTPAPFANPIQNQLLSLFPKKEGVNGVDFLTFRQYSKAYLPPTDFAYAWRESKSCSLCFNRKVRDALVSGRIIRAEECEPIKIWEECPPGSQVLDGICEIFPKGNAWFSEEKFALVSQQAEKAWVKHLANPKPKRQATIKTALKLLEEVKAAQPESFNPKLKKAELEAAINDNQIGCPNHWLEVLKFANGFNFSLEDSFEAQPLDCIDGYSSDTQERAECGDANFPKNLLHITHGLCGDFHSLDLSKQSADGDCRVLQISHETLQPEREWESIADFVQEIAETMLAETGDD